MNIDQSNINELLNKYIGFTNRICEENQYPNNIKHVLYLIIPAFVIKYGLKHESMILNCFESIKIHIHEKENTNCTAYFSRILQKSPEGEKPKYYTIKAIVLNQYKNASLVDMLDNVTHEFNHAVNSMINEIKYDDKIVGMRTGLSYMIYDINDITRIKEKTKDITLEEIINTKQTEDIIEIIRSFSKYDVHNEEFNNTFYALNHSINGEYTSNAYYLQSYICKELMDNKTFIPTIENLRFKGNVDDIESWFDNITGNEGSYRELTLLLDTILEDEEKLAKAKWFKNYKINKIREKMRRVMDIIKDYENNCIFK
jgi:hypothetical protein